MPKPELSPAFLILIYQSYFKLEQRLLWYIGLPHKRGARFVPRKKFKIYQSPKGFVIYVISLLLVMMLAAGASDINISSQITTPQVFAANGDTLTIQNGGNLAVTDAPAVTNSRSNIRIILDGGNISATENFSAISNSGSIALLKINSGQISSNFESGATIAIGGSSASAVANSDCVASTTCIINSGNILNSASSGFAINFGVANTTNRNLNITNNGTIRVSNSVDSRAINILSDSNGGSKYTLNNNGLIDAGNSGTAFYTSETASNNTTTINNSGIINGAIAVASTANLSLTNSGTINGSLNLGNNSGSNILLNGGIISGNILMNHASQTLDFNGGTVNGNIEGVGQIFVNSQTNLSGNLTASAISLSAASILNAGNFNINSSSNITLAGGAILNLGSGIISANIQSFGADNIGEINFLESNILHGNLGNGATRSIGLVNIGAEKELSVNGFNIDAQTVLLNQNAKLIFTSGSIKAAAINLSAGAVLTLGNLAPNAVIQGANAGEGKVIFNENYTLSANLANASNSLAAIEIGAGKIFNSGNFSLNANHIILNSQSEINLANASIKEAGAVFGNAIFSALNSDLDFFSGNFITKSEIRNSNNVNVGEASTLILNHNINANNFNVAGNLNLGNSAHFISGNFSTQAGSNLKLEILSQTNSGSVVASGIATVDPQTHLEISLNNSYYIPSNTIFKIVSGALGSSISAVDVNVNGSNTNQFGSMIFTTQNLENSLVLVVTRTLNQTLIQNPETKNIYQNITQTKNNGPELLALQEYLDSENIDDSQKIVTLKSLNPPTDNSVNSESFNNAKLSINTAIDRLQNFYGVASGDEPEGFGIWGKAFQTSAMQKNVDTTSGYNSKSSGFVFGADKEVRNNLFLGASLSYAKSAIDSNDNLKTSAIDTYQFNFYGSRNFRNFFLNSILGFSQNQYSSQRKINFQNLVAKADYKGYTYIAKIEIGAANKIENDFVFTPTISSTYAESSVEKYHEKGAGSLNLEVKTKNTKFFEARIGAALAYNKITSKGLRLSPNIKASYGHDFAATNQSSSINFIGQSNSFESQGPNVKRGSALFGAGLNIYTSNALTFTFDYILEQRSGYKANSISTNLRYDF